VWGQSASIPAPTPSVLSWTVGGGEGEIPPQFQARKLQPTLALLARFVPTATPTLRFGHRHPLISWIGQCACQIKRSTGSRFAREGGAHTKTRRRRRTQTHTVRRSRFLRTKMSLVFFSSLGCVLLADPRSTWRELASPLADPSVQRVEPAKRLGRYAGGRASLPLSAADRAPAIMSTPPPRSEVFS